MLNMLVSCINEGYRLIDCSLPSVLLANRSYLFPGQSQRWGCDDKQRPLFAIVTCHTDRLNGLTQTHVICNQHTAIMTNTETLEEMAKQNESSKVPTSLPGLIHHFNAKVNIQLKHKPHSLFLKWHQSFDQCGINWVKVDFISGKVL